jgi:hypothetical protein
MFGRHCCARRGLERYVLTLVKHFFIFLTWPGVLDLQKEQDGYFVSRIRWMACLIFRSCLNLDDNIIYSYLNLQA